MTLLLSTLLMIGSYKKNNMIGIIYWAVFIFLAAGQAIHITLSLEKYDYAVYLYNVISLQGHRLASYCLFTIVFILFLIDKAHQKNEFATEIDYLLVKDNEEKKKVSMSPIYYGLLFMLQAVLTVLVINLVGGVSAWLLSDRSTASGTTFLIIGLGAMTYPWLIKIASNYYVNFFDRIMYVISIILILSFSRIMAIYHLLMLLVVYVYSQRTSNGIQLKRYRFVIMFSGLLIFIMMFAYGSYRHVVPMVGSSNILKIINYIVQNPESTLFSLDLNYRISIEAMSGLSGVMTEIINSGKLRADFGISLLEGLVQLIPSYFRKNLGDIPAEIQSFYWYPNSIVSGGLEGIFVHFSFLGLFIYPFIFFAFSNGIDKKLKDIRSAFDNKNANKRILLLAIYSAYGLQLIRGSISLMIFTTISEIVVMLLSVKLFSFFMRKKI
ncbi:hypothetical protein ['Paenibacillus yunnanensis' Narsing Rao et al. 2020]|uniref:hypothetical protein n=1 Tax=Paenibacillus tengchongensis TaxID=2608684 RepID=UPI0016527BD4|nr:hypothetical protein [Paenibacillus tengchongensis]